MAFCTEHLSCSVFNLSVNLYLYITLNNLPKVIGCCTCLHLHRNPRRSLCCSSSTTIMRGDCTETTPSSAGRKGCGPSPETKEAKPKKCRFSLLFAVSGKEVRHNNFLHFSRGISLSNKSTLPQILYKFLTLHFGFDKSQK